MKLTKIINNKSIQLEVNKFELDLMTLALDNYACFLEWSLKTKVIHPLDRKENSIEVTDEMASRFTKQAKLLKPMLEILYLFY